MTEIMLLAQAGPIRATFALLDSESSWIALYRGFEPRLSCVQRQLLVVILGKRDSG